MKNWIPCSLVVFLALSPLESHGQSGGSAWVSFNGFDRKHIQYSFRDQGWWGHEELAELVVQDPQGKQTVLASWAGMEAEGKYRLADVMTGNYSLMLRRYYGDYGEDDVQLGSFPGKTAEISGTPLFDETIDGSNYTNILVDRLQVSTNITLTLKNITQGSLNILNNQVDISGTLVWDKCELGSIRVAGTNGVFKATDCTFKGQLVCLDFDQVTLKTCGVYSGMLIGTKYDWFLWNGTKPVGTLWVEDCVFFGELFVAVSRSWRIEKSEFHQSDLVLSTNVPATVRNNVFFTSALRIPALMHGGTLPTIENNSFWGHESVTTYGTGNAGFQSIPMPDNYWGGPEGPRYATTGYAAGGWLDAMGSYTALFNGVDPVKPEGASKVSSVSIDQPLPFPEIWIEGRQVGQHSLYANVSVGLNSRQDQDTLLCYDVRTSVPILPGVKFWIDCNGHTILPMNPGYTLRRDYGPPDLGVNNQDRTLNFLIPAGAGINQLKMQLWCDTSGVSDYAPPGSLISQGWMESPWTISMIPPPTRSLKVGYVTIELSSGRVGMESTVMFMQRLARDLASMCPLRRQLSEIEMIALPPVSYQGWWWRKYFTSSFVNEVVPTFSSYLKEYNGSHSKQLDFLVIIMPTGSPLGADAVNSGWDRKLLLIGDGQHAASIHELGHALGLWTGSEQYSMISSCLTPDFTMVCGVGSRLMGMTAFDPENQGSEAVPNRIRHFPHIKTSPGFDVMGGDTATPQPRWMMPSTYAGFVQGLMGLLWSAPAGASSSAVLPTASSSNELALATADAILSEPNGIRASASGTNRVLRVLFRGLCSNSGVLLPESVICSDVTSTAQRPIGDGNSPLNVTFRALTRGGLEVVSKACLVRRNFLTTNAPAVLDWTQSFDVPLDPDPYWHPVRYELHKIGTQEPLFTQTISDKVSNSLQGPSSGSTLGPNLRLTWTASLDGTNYATQRLQNQLYFSTDGKLTWAPILSSGFSNQVDSPTDFLPVTNNIALKLVTSDGFKSTESILDNLIITNRAPVVVIRSPQPGDQGVTNTLWLLDASVTEVEHGEISTGRWVSSLDGLLGTSARLAAVSLSPGTHTLSFTSQDSQLATNIAQVVVTVGEMPTVDLAVAADSLWIKPYGLDPIKNASNQLRLGRSHTIIAAARNQGITNTAQLKLFIQEPGGTERLLTEKTLEWLPFAMDYAQVDYTPTIRGAYRFRLQLEPLSLADSNPGNNQYTWIITNLPPQAISLALAAESAMVAPIGLWGSDPEEAPLTYTLLTNPKHGTLTGTPPNLTYLSTGYVGLDSFTFKVNDGELDSPTATITLNVISSLPAQYTITAVAGTGGSIKPGGNTVKNRGESLSFTATPDLAYSVDKWYLNGTHVQSGGTGFSLTSIQNDGKVEVTFFQPSLAGTVMAVGGSYGRTASVPVVLIGKGNENMFGFGLSWRPEVLRFEAAQLGSALGSALLETATNEAPLGRAGFKIRLPQGTGLNAGTNELLRLAFARVADGWSPVSFGDQPVLLWVSDLNATAVPVLWVEASVSVADVPNNPTLTVTPITPETLAKSGFPFTVIGPRYIQYRTEYSSNLVNWIPLRTDSSMSLEIFITDPEATNIPMRFYRVLMQR